MRQGQYPPLRGTTFTLGPDSYLYAAGYIPALGYYPEGHVPTPLLVADHVGDTPTRPAAARDPPADQDELELCRVRRALPITCRSVSRERDQHR